MVRNRTTVKPGLLLQPFVLDRLSGLLVEEVVAGSGLTGNEFAVASWLAVRGPATPTELAADLGMAPTTLSTIIERLAAKGQVRRRPHAEDGRSYVLELTAKGKSTNARNGARFEKVIGRLRANLAADEQAILDHMSLLEDAMRRTLAG